MTCLQFSRLAIGLCVIVVSARSAFAVTEPGEDLRGNLQLRPSDSSDPNWFATDFAPARKARCAPGDERLDPGCLAGFKVGQRALCAEESVL